MRQGWPAVVALMFVAACGAGNGSSASCVGPQLVSLSPDEGAADAAVTLTVEWLRDGCNDYTGADEGRPRKDVPVYFSQRADETLVGTLSGTGAHFRGSIRFLVPTTARPGPATLLLGPERQHIPTFAVGAS